MQKLRQNHYNVTVIYADGHSALLGQLTLSLDQPPGEERTTVRPRWQLSINNLWAGEGPKWPVTALSRESIEEYAIEKLRRSGLPVPLQ